MNKSDSSYTQNGSRVMSDAKLFRKQRFQALSECFREVLAASDTPNRCYESYRVGMILRKYDNFRRRGWKRCQAVEMVASLGSANSTKNYTDELVKKAVMLWLKRNPRYDTAVKEH